MNLFAPGLWELSVNVSPKIDQGFPELHLVMWNVAARELFNGEWTPVAASALRQFMRRSLIAVAKYNDGRAKLLDFMANRDRSRPKLREYFGALNDFEDCILQLEFCVENVKHVFLSSEDSKKLLEATSHISELSKSIRHSGGRAKSKAQKVERSVLPVYFWDNGVTNGSHSVTFEFLRECAIDFASLTARIYEKGPSG